MRAWLARRSFAARLLGLVWLGFFLLVALRIHGSSIALSAELWAPDEANSHFLAQPLLDALGTSSKTAREVLMAMPREVRSDEYATSTLWSMAQFSHVPRFPVRNLNIGDGQNMLLVSWVPVWHPSSIARPVTWGYMLFGPEAGLAWLWWFSPFFCFSTIFLVLNIVLRERGYLAALGALWFASSAYMVCWSHFPAYTIGFAAMGTVGAYHVFSARSLRAALLAALATGYGAAGFVMQLYPPWMVPLAYVFVTMLIALIVRDRLWRGLAGGHLAIAAALVVATAVAILASFVLESLPELHALARSAYPGRRRLNGGDCNLAHLFGALYNFSTIRRRTTAAENPSEWSGFFLFYPTVLLAVLLFPRVRRSFDAVAWSLLVLGAALILYGKYHFPQWLADVTGWSYMQAFRAQLAVGLLSIVLTMYLLLPEVVPRSWDRRERLAVALIALASAVFFLWVGLSLQHQRSVFSTTAFVPWQIVVGTSGAGAAALLLALGKARAFAALLLPALLVTSGNFNPLSVGFASIEASELRQAIEQEVERDRAEGHHSLWIASGGPQEPLVGTVISVMGARSLTGAFFHPQLSLWHRIDPTRKWETTYNRYAEIHYFQLPARDRSISFTLPTPANFNVRVSPWNPILRQMGVRFALTFGKDRHIRTPPFKLLHDAGAKYFRIWELPDPDHQLDDASETEAPPPPPTTLRGGKKKKKGER